LAEEIMKNERVRTKLIAIAIVIGALAASWAVSGSRRVAATDENREEFLAYGIANITRGQTARLHVVSVGNPNDVPAELVIYSSQGEVLARSSERLIPGKAVFLDLSFDQQPAVAGNRLEFYAVVRFDLGRGRGYVIPTLKVLEDVTGKSILMVADPLG
jgi:hypothetical protein